MDSYLLAAFTVFFLALLAVGSYAFEQYRLRHPRSHH
jgi:hypothetical protein